MPGLWLLAIIVARGDEPDPPTVEVRGARVDPGATSAAVTVIDVGPLPQSADVAAAVDEAPGAVVQHLGGLGDWSAVSLRGSSLRQVLVAIDGVPLNPDGVGAIDLSELPLRAFERVEVYRGLAPPELGSQAMGGVVNLVTPAGGAPASLSIAGGSWVTGRVHASAGPVGTIAGREARGFVAVDALSTQGDYPYLDDRGTIYVADDDEVLRRGNADTRQVSAHARLAVGDDRLRITVLDSALSREEGVPGPIGRPTVAVRLATARDVAVAQVDGGSDRLRATGRVWGHAREERLDDRRGEVGVGAEQTRDTTSAVGAHGELRWRAVPGTTLVAVADVRRDAWHGRDALSGDDRHVRLAATGTVGATVHLADERVGLYPAVQATWVQAAATAVTPRLGVLVRPAPWLAVKANAGTYLRPPDFLELYGDRGATVGSPDLRPERGWQVDVGGRMVLPDVPVVKGTLEIAHFWSGARDLVVWVQNSQRTTYPVNLDRTWVQGVEGALALAFADVVRTRTTLTRTVSVNLSTDPAYANKALPRIPGWEVEHRTSVQVGRFSASHGISYTAGSYWDATNWYPAAPRLLHSATVEVDAGRGFTVGVDVLNLLDRTWREEPRNPLDPADPATIRRPITDFVGYPLPGRTVLASVRWTAP